MGLSGDAALHLLLDPAYWQPRLARLQESPRGLAIFDRPDLGRPGFEVRELRLNSHDGHRLTALLARCAFVREGSLVRVRPCSGPQLPEPRWEALEAGECDIVFRYPGPPGRRRLEDRVLDLLRIVSAACSLESVDCSQVVLTPDPPAPPPDECTLVEGLRARGWVSHLAHPPES